MDTHSPKQRILIVDDDPSVFDFFKLHLGQLYELYFLNHPKQILSHVRSISPDLIMCDIDMPEINGGEVSRLLSESDKFSLVPFIYLTSYVSPQEVERLGGNVGGRDGISKFTPLPEMLEKIRSYLPGY